MSMPSRAVTSFLQRRQRKVLFIITCVNALSGCYLISTTRKDYSTAWVLYCVNALSGCYLISTSRRVIIYDYESIEGVNALSGCYLISTYPFKNLGFMRFPEPVFAGICQNILTATHFHAC